ncbi:hypothetical protein FOA52_001342 [Chlamydomonas sp. UWO 241]|nr:hypothetical protein FOA52_001342 [Chlamydomonas sp. UWO 241]
MLMMRTTTMKTQLRRVRNCLKGLVCCASSPAVEDFASCRDDQGHFVPVAASARTPGDADPSPIVGGAQTCLDECALAGLSDLEQQPWRGQGLGCSYTVSLPGLQYDHEALALIEHNETMAAHAAGEPAGDSPPGPACMRTVPLLPFGVGGSAPCNAAAHATAEPAAGSTHILCRVPLLSIGGAARGAAAISTVEPAVGSIPCRLPPLPISGGATRDAAALPTVKPAAGSVFIPRRVPPLSFGGGAARDAAALSAVEFAAGSIPRHAKSASSGGNVPRDAVAGNLGIAGPHAQLTSLSAQTSFCMQPLGNGEGDSEDDDNLLHTLQLVLAQGGSLTASMQHQSPLDSGLRHNQEWEVTRQFDNGNAECAVLALNDQLSAAARCGAGGGMGNAAHQLRLLRLLSPQFFDAGGFDERREHAHGESATIYSAIMRTAALQPQAHAAGAPGAVGSQQVVNKAVGLPTSQHERNVLAVVYAEVSMLERSRGRAGICQMVSYGRTGTAYWVSLALINHGHHTLPSTLHSCLLLTPQMVSYGRTDTAYWIVLQRYRCSLSEWRSRLAGEGPCNARIARMLLSVFLQVLASVKMLADDKVAHFDIESDNVLIEPLEDVTDAQLFDLLGATAAAADSIDIGSSGLQASNASSPASTNICIAARPRAFNASGLASTNICSVAGPRAFNASGLASINIGGDSSSSGGPQAPNVSSLASTDIAALSALDNACLHRPRVAAVSHFSSTIDAASAADSNSHLGGLLASDASGLSLLRPPFHTILADWGEAVSYREQSLSQQQEAFTTRTCGTEQYMAPEMLLLGRASPAATSDQPPPPRSHSESGAACDVWSLGCVLLRRVWGLSLDASKVAALGGRAELVELVQWVLVRDPRERLSLEQIEARVADVQAGLLLQRPP